MFTSGVLTCMLDKEAVCFYIFSTTRNVYHLVILYDESVHHIAQHVDGEHLKQLAKHLHIKPNETRRITSRQPDQVKAARELLMVI